MEWHFLIKWDLPRGKAIISFLFLSQIPYVSEENMGNEPVLSKWNGKFQYDQYD